MPSSSDPVPARIGLSILAFIVLTIPVRVTAQGAGTNFEPAGAKLALAERLGIQKIEIDSTGKVATQTEDTTASLRHPKSPLAAVLLSVIPGGGQIYNGSYWKVPIVWGIQGFFVYEWILNNRQYRSYQQAVTDSIAAGDPYQSNDPSITDLETLISQRNGAQDQRDSYAWYIAGTYLLSMLDAYVDAELSGFDVSPNLSSTPTGKIYSLSFRMKF